MNHLPSAELHVRLVIGLGGLGATHHHPDAFGWR